MSNDDQNEQEPDLYVMGQPIWAPQPRDLITIIMGMAGFVLVVMSGNFLSEMLSGEPLWPLAAWQMVVAMSTAALPTLISSTTRVPYLPLIRWFLVIVAALIALVTLLAPFMWVLAG